VDRGVARHLKEDSRDYVRAGLNFPEHSRSPIILHCVKNCQFSEEATFLIKRINVSIYLSAGWSKLRQFALICPAVSSERPDGHGRPCRIIKSMKRTGLCKKICRVNIIQRTESNANESTLYLRRISHFRAHGCTIAICGNSNKNCARNTL